MAAGSGSYGAGNWGHRAPENPKDSGRPPHLSLRRRLEIRNAQTRTKPFPPEKHG